MKLSISLLTLALSALIAADGISFGVGAGLTARDLSAFGAQKALGDGGAVPGDNPLTYCKKEHDDDLLVLEKVNLTPNPPLKCVSSNLCTPLPQVWNLLGRQKGWRKRECACGIEADLFLNTEAPP